MPTEESPQAGQHLGRYRLVTTLGQGGMGTIWLAVAGGLGEFRKLLVVKELRWDLTRNPRFVEMFLDEAKLAARLNHPNVVQTLEAGQEDQRYFLSMEFLDGQPLSEVMLRATVDPLISLGVRLRILCGALSGLHYAHELRDYDGTELHIVHRDISPQNVFVTYDGQVKVVDFGIAKAADAGTLTQPGVFKGKFAYASPEQIKGQPVDRRADVFAMGVLLWELITLQRFAKGKPSQASIDARVAGTEQRLSQTNADVEPLLCEICDRAMSVDPNARYATAEEFRVAIEQFLLVSGDRVDSTTIAVVMQTAFTAERARMYRMIDAHLKEAELSESLVRQLRPSPSRGLGDDNPTSVADLSELVESSRAELDAEMRAAVGRQRIQPRLLWLGLSAAVAIGGIGFYALRSSSGSADAAGGERAVPLPPAPAAAAPPVPEPPAAVVAPPVPAPPQPAPRAERQAIEPAPAARAAVASENAAGRAKQASAPSERKRVMATPGSPFAAIADDDSPLGTAADPAPAAPSSAGDDDGFGEDLRRLHKREPRALDLEDPFK